MNIDTINNLREVTQDKNLSVKKANELFMLVGVNPYSIVRSFLRIKENEKIFVGVMQDNTVLWIVSNHLQGEKDNSKQNWIITYGDRKFSNLVYDSANQRWKATRTV